MGGGQEMQPIGGGGLMGGAAPQPWSLAQPPQQAQQPTYSGSGLARFGMQPSVPRVAYQPRSYAAPNVPFRPVSAGGGGAPGGLLGGNNAGDSADGGYGGSLGASQGQGGMQPGFAADGMTAVSPNTGLSNGMANALGTALGLGLGVPGLGLAGSMANNAVNAQHGITTASRGAQMDTSPAHNGDIGGFLGAGALSEGINSYGDQEASFGGPAAGGGFGGNSGENGPGVGEGVDSNDGGLSAGLGTESGDGGGGGGKVICAELFRQGRLEQRLYELDEAFGAALALADPLALEGYQRWARPVVRVMRRSPRFSAVVAILARPWVLEMVREMGHGRGSLLGRLMMLVGLPLCRALGRQPEEATA